MEQPYPPPIPLEQRRAILGQAVSAAIARGGVVQTQTDTTVALTFGRPVNHILHLLIALFTCGLWAIVWLILAATGGQKRQIITVDDWGNLGGYTTS